MLGWSAPISVNRDPWTRPPEKKAEQGPANAGPFPRSTAIGSETAYIIPNVGHHPPTPPILVRNL